MTSLIPYIGGKHRIAGRIAERLHAYGRDTLVDVFGGSAAVILNAGFSKRIYNDRSEDLVNLFRVMASAETRRLLFKSLRWTPPSRAVFQKDYTTYLRGGYSFRYLTDSVERARATFYRHHFSFGGKTRNGGFCLSIGDPGRIKEIQRYRNTLRRLNRIGDFFRSTAIECLDFQDVIRIYGQNRNTVFYVDPPYDGTEHYYCCDFSAGSHVFLSELLNTVPAPAVVSYYDTPLIRELYPESRWTFENIIATKNGQFRGGQKAKTQELLISRKVAA